MVVCRPGNSAVGVEIVGAGSSDELGWFVDGHVRTEEVSLAPHRSFTGTVPQHVSGM